MYPSPTPFRVPGETLGHVRAAASPMSHPLLEVPLRTRRVRAWVCGGSISEGAAVAGHPLFVELPLLAFLSSSLFLSLFFGLVVLLARAFLCHRCWLLCNTKRGETLFR